MGGWDGGAAGWGAGVFWVGVLGLWWLVCGGCWKKFLFEEFGDVFGRNWVDLVRNVRERQSCKECEGWPGRGDSFGAIWRMNDNDDAVIVINVKLRKGINLRIRLRFHFLSQVRTNSLPFNKRTHQFIIQYDCELGQESNGGLSSKTWTKRRKISKGKNCYREWLV